MKISWIEQKLQQIVSRFSQNPAWFPGQSESQESTEQKDYVGSQAFQAHSKEARDERAQLQLKLPDSTLWKESRSPGTVGLSQSYRPWKLLTPQQGSWKLGPGLYGLSSYRGRSMLVLEVLGDPPLTVADRIQVQVCLKEPGYPVIGLQRPWLLHSLQHCQQTSNYPGKWEIHIQLSSRLTGPRTQVYSFLLLD